MACRFVQSDLIGSCHCHLRRRRYIDLTALQTVRNAQLSITSELLTNHSRSSNKVSNGVWNLDKKTAHPPLRAGTFLAAVNKYSYSLVRKFSWFIYSSYCRLSVQFRVPHISSTPTMPYYLLVDIRKVVFLLYLFYLFWGII